MHSAKSTIKSVLLNPVANMRDSKNDETSRRRGLSSSHKFIDSWRSMCTKKRGEHTYGARADQVYSRSIVLTSEQPVLL